MLGGFHDIGKSVTGRVHYHLARQGLSARLPKKLGRDFWKGKRSAAERWAMRAADLAGRAVRLAMFRMRQAFDAGGLARACVCVSCRPLAGRRSMGRRCLAPPPPRIKAPAATLHRNLVPTRRSRQGMERPERPKASFTSTASATHRLQQVQVGVRTPGRVRDPRTACCFRGSAGLLGDSSDSSLFASGPPMRSCCSDGAGADGAEAIGRDTTGRSAGLAVSKASTIILGVHTLIKADLR